ncbi:antibiotic biosynthesis monooxygenase family protein [Marmoricola endophyticus]|uniref:antibiotic biosynthesis monooxygenase family protein n=1 Tax=Marmoricola endophyticus TaxID=2040280 RepID=UPI00166A336C|nr:antibiotic biosynthesis monooxygenase [Marmoricola endophyticus]
MITEHALLPVVPGREGEFEAAMQRAAPLVAASPGFVRLSVTRGVESPSTYLLVVEWERLEDHTEGFRRSAAYEDWRALLHEFYDPFPVVEHFAPVLDVRA